MASFSSVLFFLLSTFSSVHRANCALFLQFTALIVPFWRSVHRTFFRYIVISSNSTLPIMKRNRNGISLFLKWKITFFETENHWPYISIRWRNSFSMWGRGHSATPYLLSWYIISPTSLPLFFFYCIYPIDTLSPSLQMSHILGSLLPPSSFCPVVLSCWLLHQSVVFFSLNIYVKLLLVFNSHQLAYKLFLGQTFNPHQM